MNGDNPPKPVPSGQDVPPEGGAGNAPPTGDTSEATLKAINEAAGREYKNIEEANKGIKETFGFVGQMGDLKEKAKKYDAIQEKKSQKQKEKDGRTEDTDRMNRLEFLFKNPDAKFVPGVENDIQAVAKQKGISMEEVYKDSVFSRQVETEKKSQEAASPQGIEGSRLPEGKAGISLEDFKALSQEKKDEIVMSLPSFQSFKKSPQTPK